MVCFGWKADCLNIPSGQVVRFCPRNCWREGELPEVPFPRPSRRGPIEAGVCGRAPSGGGPFPRPSRRGPIEAPGAC